MNYNMRKIKLILSGRVQDIGYRYFVRSKAQLFNINGWIKNMSSGEVVIIAEGKDEALNQFKKICKEGPLFANIDTFEEEDLEFRNEFDDFKVIF